MSQSIKKKLFIFFTFGLILSPHFEALSAEALSAPIEESSRIVVNIPALELSLFKNGRLIYRFPIAIGSPVHETPVGSMELKQIVWNPWWIPPKSAWAADEKKTPPGPENPLGPVKMELDGAMRLHGTSDELSVGYAVSHGCIRLLNADAKTLAWWIQSHFTQKNNPSLLGKYAEQKNKSYYVLLDTPLVVDIRYDTVEVGTNVLKIHPDIYRKMGSVKELVYAALKERGLNPEQIDGRILRRFLSGLKTKTISIAITALMSDKEKLALN